MSKRGIDFLELWVLDNATPGHTATDIARRCVADALAAGISREEMEEEVGFLASFIAAALAHPADGGT